jgi:elongation factor P--(R)-beta-lysine ligase
MDEIIDGWRPTASLSSLQRRSEAVWKIRSFFQSSGFWEVHTPTLSRETIADRHIDPMRIPGEILNVSGLENLTFFLQTSPEFAMKRLLAAGAERIYQIGPVFRAGERGTMHNPEFTMLEWYRSGDTLEDGIDLLAQVIQTVLPHSQVHRITYQAAFSQHAGLCPLSGTLDDLCNAARQHGLSVDQQWSCDRDDWLNLLFAEIVQPNLGTDTPTIVTHYPASQCALARVCPKDPRVAERYELFIAGVELANGYHELLDADEFAARTHSVRQQRELDGKEPLNESSRLLAAMKAGLPASSGCALGLDRLLMVLDQASSIDQVICFPIERA